MSGAATGNPLLAVIDEMLRLQSCFEVLFAEVSSASSLSTLQKLVVFAVFDAPTPPTVPQIGRDLGHPRQVVQRVVNELVNAGLLEKAPNPHHKRASLLTPTDKAQKMKREAEARAFDTAEAFLGTINATRCYNLTGELKALRQAIEAYTQDTASGGKVADMADHRAGSPLTLIEKLN